LSARTISDERLHQAWMRCPDDNHVLVPTGQMRSADGTGRSWSIAFRCPQHPDETLYIWTPDLQPLIAEILADHPDS
jgi:hypothetical protein